MSRAEGRFAMLDQHVGRLDRDLSIPANFRRLDGALMVVSHDPAPALLRKAPSGRRAAVSLAALAPAPPVRPGAGGPDPGF